MLSPGRVAADLVFLGASLSRIKPRKISLKLLGFLMWKLTSSKISLMTITVITIMMIK